MVFGMASVKVTITLPADQLAEVRRLVESGQARSVSGFVQGAVATAIDDAAGWHLAVEEALARTGGPMTDEERTWADAILDGPSRSVA